MSKRAEEMAKQLYPAPKLEDYDDILVYRADRDNAIMGRSNVICVYEQAEKDTIELAQLWADSGDANIMSFEQFLKLKEELWIKQQKNLLSGKKPTTPWLLVVMRLRI